MTLTLIYALAQSPSSKPLPAYDRQLIDQQKQFLQMAQAKDPAAVERAIADDFQGIGTNGYFYDKRRTCRSGGAALSKDTRAYDFHVVKLNDDSAIETRNERSRKTG